MNINVEKTVGRPSSVPVPSSTLSLFNKDIHYYICSSGGCGSTILFEYLRQFGHVYHIHDRYPPERLCYVGKENTENPVYSEWFNQTEIPPDKLGRYKVIFIYRHPIEVIFSRFAGVHGPKVDHLQHIRCPQNGNIWLGNVIKSGRDLYELEEFFDHYTLPRNRNYPIYCVKYEPLFQHMAEFNRVLGIPDVPSLYPIKVERRKKYMFVRELTTIYRSLIRKMNAKPFIQVIGDVSPPAV